MKSLKKPKPKIKKFKFEDLEDAIWHIWHELYNIRDCLEILIEQKSDKPSKDEKND